MILSQKVKVEITRSSDIFPFWEKSKQRTIFNNPKFLEIFDYKFFWWTATFGDEKICCWPICIDKDRVVIPDFFYYFGRIIIIIIDSFIIKNYVIFIKRCLF